MKLKGDYKGIPYDFSLRTLRKFRSRWWNKDESRLIVPKAFGLGYDINLYQVKKRYPRLFLLLVAGAAAALVSGLLASDSEENKKD